MTLNMGARLTGIRSGCIAFNDYLKFLQIEESTAKLRFAYDIPVIRTTLEAFHPIVDQNLRAIFDGSLKTDSKKGRKALRHVTMLMARGATRATPSRLVGRVGLVHSDAANDAGSNGNVQLTLHDDVVIGCIDPISTDEENEEQPRELRWNPSAVEVGNRYYLTAPRTENEPFSSVGRNKLLDRIVALTMMPMGWDALVQQLVEEFHVDDVKFVEKSLDTLLQKEFLLGSTDVGYRQRCRTQNISTVSSKGNALEAHTRHWILENKHSDFEVRRDADVHIGARTLASLERCYSFLLQHELVQTTDQGVANTLAEIVHERYGFSRVCVQDLLHPAFGISYQDIVEQFNNTRDINPPEELVELCAWATARGQRWIDLKAPEVRAIVSSRKAQLGQKYSISPGTFSVPVVPMRDPSDASKVQFIACDGTVALPGHNLTARYRLLADAAVSTIKHKNGETKAGVDWISNRKEVNSIRELNIEESCTLNVNAFETPNDEILAKDLYVWSDGNRMYIEKEDGTRLRFEPTSMASIQLYPDWIRILYLITTANWPMMCWSWEPLARHHHVLPGVRYGNVILQRPKFRYFGELTPKAFNAWCDEREISCFVRLGSHDRKILVDREAIHDDSTLTHLLKSGEHWIEDAEFESGLPLCTDSSGNSIHSELIVEFDLPASEQERVSQVAPRFEDISNHGTEQLIPATGDWANLELVPRGGSLNALIGLLPKLHAPCYFVRYRTSNGKTCLRLRLPRSEMMREETRAFINSLAWDGWVTAITEQQHRLEIERYGGERAFDVFQGLFIAESAFISWLASKKLLNSLALDDRAFLLHRWVEISPIRIEIIQAQGRSNGIQKSRKAKVEIPDVFPEALASYRDTIDHYFDLISNQMEALCALPSDLHESWGVAAHLFCNRIGITPDEEQVVWKALVKNARRLERV